jgi:hypothetical protein
LSSRMCKAMSSPMEMISPTVRLKTSMAVVLFE